MYMYITIKNVKSSLCPTFCENKRTHHLTDVKNGNSVQYNLAPIKKLLFGT